MFFMILYIYRTVFDLAKKSRKLDKCILMSKKQIYTNMDWYGSDPPPPTHKKSLSTPPPVVKPLLPTLSTLVTYLKRVDEDIVDVGNALTRSHFSEF